MDKKRFAICLFCVVAVFGGVVCYARDAATGERIRISVDYLVKLQEMAKPNGYNPQKDARPYYEKAIAAVVEAPKELKRNDLDAWPGDLDAAKLRAMRGWVKANEEALAMLPRATGLPYYVPKYEGDSLLYIKVPVRMMRQLALACCARARLRATQGQSKNALYDCIRCYRLGQQVGGAKTVIEQLVGIGIRVKAAQACREILARTSVDSVLLRKVQAEMERMVKKEPAISFAAERLTVRDCIQRAFTDDGTGAGHFTSNVDVTFKDMLDVIRKFNSMSAGWKEQWESLDRRETVRLAERAADFMDSIVEKSPAYWRNAGKDPSEVLSKMVQDNAFVSMFVPAAGKVVELNCRAKAELEASIATLGLLRCKADKGAFPERLEELRRARFIKALPIDPYTDKTLVYKRTGDSFVLYSVGEDFDDDGGTYSKWGRGKEGGDQVFWPIKKRP